MRNAGIHSKGRNLGLRIIIACLTTLLFRVALDFVYVNYVARVYAADFPLDASDGLRLLESYMIPLGLGGWLALSVYSKWRPTGFFLVYYFAIVVIPLSSLYGLANAPASFIYGAVGCFGFLVLVTHVLPKVKIPQPGKGLLYVGIVIVAGISAYVYGMLVASGGLKRLSFDLLSVYEVRADYVQTAGPFMGYFVPWQAHVFNMGLFSLGLQRKNFRLLGIAVLAQVLLFGMTGFKSFMLAPLLVGGVYLVWQRKNVIPYILGGGILVVLASYAIFLTTGSEWVPSIFIRRLFFVPARLHVIYYEFFSEPEHPYFMLSGSIFRPFIKNPYGVPIPVVIARAYWGREFWPDVGYLGDAYANFGFFGMLLFSAILGVILRILDSVASRLPPQFVAATISMPAMALTESALFTSMLTHGLILAGLMIWIIQAAYSQGAKKCDRPCYAALPR